MIAPALAVVKAAAPPAGHRGASSRIIGGVSVSPKPDPAELAQASRPRRIGCVSYLNSKPLIDGLEHRDDLQVHLDVPAKLLAALEQGQVDLALCPVIDYHLAAQPLVMVPVGGIASEGPTLTVRLFSRVPIEQIQTLHADTHSHTSVVLAQVLLQKLHGASPAIVPHEAAKAEHGALPESLLLIGDKVVNTSPAAVLYPHQLDLGEAWHALNGLPFVFATWMARPGIDLGNLPRLLEAQRRENAPRAAAIADRHAPALGWPPSLAREYLTRVLRYEIGSREVEAMERFADLALELNLIPRRRPLQFYKGSSDSSPVAPNAKQQP